MLLIAITFGALEMVLDRGQEDDWFKSNLIVTFALIAAAAFIFFIFWELTEDDPIVDIRLLCQRQFGMAIPGHDDGRRDPVRLDPDHAAAVADQLSLYGGAVGACGDAGRTGDAGA